MSDPISPDYYKAGIFFECIDVIEEATRDLSGTDAYCTGNAIKYLWRWKKKGGVTDLKKARWYVERLIQVNEQALEVLSREHEHRKLHTVPSTPSNDCQHEEPRDSKLQKGTGGTSTPSEERSEGIQPDGTSTGTNEHSSA